MSLKIGVRTARGRMYPLLNWAKSEDRDKSESLSQGRSHCKEKESGLFFVLQCSLLGNTRLRIEWNEGSANVRNITARTKGGGREHATPLILVWGGGGVADE